MATKTKTLSERLDFDFRAAMRSRLVEREEEIEIFLLALVAKTHAFLYGEKGIAKSYLIETGMSLIDGLDQDVDYFHLLFSKFTTHEQVFGPLMLSMLKEDRLVHQPYGYLPMAKLVFGDEFWKANSAIQNDCLWATNERKWRNDGKVLDVNLWSMFIASNEVPREQELQAIYDRFPLRRTVLDIVEPGAFIDVMKLGPNKLTPLVQWHEIEQAHAEAEKVFVPGDVLEALSKIRMDLRDMGINPSTRRFKMGLDIVRAKAWLDGETEADIHHLRTLVNVLWEEPGQFNDVDKLLGNLANPIDKEIVDVLRDLGKVSSEVDELIRSSSDVDLKNRMGLQHFDTAEKAMKELTEIDKRLKGSKKRSAKLEDAKSQIERIGVRILTDLFMMPLDEVETSPLMEGFKNLKADDGE